MALEWRTMYRLLQIGLVELTLIHHNTVPRDESQQDPTGCVEMRRVRAGTNVLDQGQRFVPPLHILSYNRIFRLCWKLWLTIFLVTWISFRFIVTFFRVRVLVMNRHLNILYYGCIFPSKTCYTLSVGNYVLGTVIKVVISNDYLFLRRPIWLKIQK